MSQLMTAEAQEVFQTMGTKAGSSEDLRMAGQGEIGTHTDWDRLEEETKRLRETNSKLTRENERLKEEIDRVRLGNLKAHLNETVSITEEQVDNIKKYEDFMKYRDLAWPGNLFKVAFMAGGSPEETGNDTDLVILDEETGTQGNDRNEGLRRVWKDRYPELMNAEEPVKQLRVNTLVLDEGEGSGQYKIVTKVELKGDEKDWFDKLVAVKDKLSKSVNKKLALYPPDFEKPIGERTRRMAECIFKRSGIKCLIVSGKRIEKVNKARERVRDIRDAIIVSEAGTSYADLLRKVKTDLQTTGKDKGISTVRRTREGNLLILMQKGEEQATREIEKKLGEKGGGRVVRMGKNSGNKGVTLIIKDMDELVSKEEVLGAMERDVGRKAKDVWMEELRPCFGGNKVVTTVVPKEEGEQMIRRGGIRIGLSWCRIVERVEVLRCFKCGNYGHKAIECKGKEYCFNCKVNGHRSGANGCPVYRKALSRARLLRKKKRAY